jgi:hypothetical protein
MKRTFVLRLSPEAHPVSGRLVGKIEEVDSGRNLRFNSIEELLAFLQQCLDEQQTSAD